MARKEIPTPIAPETADLVDDLITPVNEMMEEIYDKAVN